MTVPELNAALFGTSGARAISTPALITQMLDSNKGISDLIFSPGRPPQVERLGQLKQAEDASIDFYSFVRSSYYQTRRAELREALGHSSVVDSPALADLEDPAEDPAPNAAKSASAVR